MRRQLALLFVAMQFLTKLPVPGAHALPLDALAESARFFPIVGAIVGLGAIAIDVLVSPYAGRHVSVVLILLYLMIVTGGLHDDGLADTADGFGGGWTKEQVLTIMRDSHIGSFGTLAIAFSLLARFVFLTTLPAGAFSGVILAAHVLSRWTALPLARWLPPARDEAGQGARIARKMSATTLVVGTGCMTILVCAARGLAGVPLIAVAAGVAALTGAYYRRRIGGITGDCLGATCQVTELAVYFAGVVA